MSRSECDCHYCQECLERQYGLKPRSIDQRTVAERKWQAGLKPAKPQQPCDHGLFGDDHLQMEFVTKVMS
jgi:hypothetical protein